ncbi:MAG: hypothetical protein QXR27_01965 [Archaeoglobaceae archaeon]
MELFFSRLGFKFSNPRLPPFLFGFFLPFVWLPCIFPFLGLAISEAIITERPISISISFTLGVATSTSILLFFGKKVRINFERVRKLLGVAVFISATYLLLSAI